MAARIVVTGTRGIPDVQGGVETYVENLFPLVAAAGYEVHICCRSCYIEPAKRIGAWKGCKLVYLETPRKKSLEAIVHTFKSIVYAKKVRADLVHVNAVGPALLVPFARLLGLKVVFTDHGPDYERQKWGFLAKLALRLGEAWGCRCSDAIIAISEGIRGEIARRYARADVRLIHNGVRIPVFSGSTSTLAARNIEPRRYILSVARFVEEKGLHDLVAAFSRAEVGDWKLVLAGEADHETPYSRRLKEMAAENPRVVLTGFVRGSALEELYGNAGLFVLPSYHEGLPFALLEAMSFGLPVLVSDIGPHREMGLGEAAYFPVGDVAALAGRIAAAVEGGPDGIDYRPLLRDTYDWDRIAARTMEVYESLFPFTKAR